MVYADFKFYKEVFKGIAISSETDFDSSIVKASAYIDRITFGRAKDNAGMDEVKMAACAVCEVISKNQRRYGISSENNDGFSVTFVNDSGKEAVDQKRAAYLFLPSELIYRGAL